MRLEKTARQFIDAKFHLGRWDKNGNETEGWDCLSSLYQFYTEMGFPFPIEWKGFNQKNYAELWKKSDCRAAFAEFLQTLGVEVNRNYMREGDLILCETETIPMFPAIYVGSGHCLMVFKEGVRIVPLRFLDPTIKQVRRLVNVG